MKRSNDSVRPGRRNDPFHGRCGALALLFTGASASATEGLGVEVETGAVWFSRNDTQVPGATGTRFDMLDLTGSGPDIYARFAASYAFNDAHSLRLTLAPLDDGECRPCLQSAAVLTVLAEPPPDQGATVGLSRSSGPIDISYTRSESVVVASAGVENEPNRLPSAAST